VVMCGAGGELIQCVPAAAAEYTASRCQWRVW